MNEAVALVTGATGKIGEAIARQLAERGMQVALGCRDSGRAEQVAQRIRSATGNQAIRVEQVDLSRRSSVGELAERWSGPLHVLVNNAAETPRGRQVTPEGIERQLASNVLGYFWLTRALTGILERSAPARVVNVASYWAGGLDVDDLEFERRRYDNDAAYRQSKQANGMLTVAFAERLKGKEIAVNACHPGDVNSTLSNNLGFGGHESPDQGARTPVWLATDPIGQQRTGKYFAHQREEACRFGGDREAVEALWEACLTYEDR